MPLQSRFRPRGGLQVSEVRPQVTGVIRSGCSRKGRSFARGRRSIRSTTEIRPDSPSFVKPSVGPRQRGRRADPGLALQAARRHGGHLPARTIPTPWHRRARPTPPLRRTTRPCASLRSTCVYPRAGPDHRPDRPVELHRRGAGHRGSGGRIADHHSARPHLCRHPAVGGRAAQASASARPGRWRRPCVGPSYG